MSSTPFIHNYVYFNIKEKIIKEKIKLNLLIEEGRRENMKTFKKSEIAFRDISKIFKGLIPSKGILFFAILFMLMENFISVGLPYIIMKLIDKMDLESINIFVLLSICAVFIVQLIISAVAAYILIYIAEYIICGLRKKVLNHILFLPVSYFDKNQTGDIMSRITNDTMVIKEFVTRDANIFFSDIISLIGSILLIFIIDWKIGLVVIIMSPLTSIAVSLVADREFEVSTAIQNENANLGSLLNKVISDIRLVKSYVAEKMEIENSSNIIERLCKLSLIEGRIMSIIRPFTNSVMLVLLVAIFGYGSLRVAQGTLTAGGLIAVIIYMFQMSSPASGLASFYTGYQRFCGAIKRLNEIYDYPCEDNNGVTENGIKNNKDGLIFENIYFSYDMDKEILKNISIEIELGKVTALIGPSGVGKTTIFSLIERFYRATNGRIYYNGKNILQYDMEAWRHKIAYVSQDSPIMYGTILSNLTYGMESYTQEQVERAVEQAKLKDYIESLPDKYHTQVGERGVKLSGGQRQRLAIARAMIRNPEILLLDEATSHLDSDSEKLVKESLDILMRGRTTLIIAHNLSTIKNATKLIVLENGEVTGIGSHEELSEGHPLYQRFIEQQSY